MIQRLYILQPILMALVLSGCTEEKISTQGTIPQEPSQEPSQAPSEQDLPSANSDDAGSSSISPVPNRDTRRLSIRALQTSLEQVTGVVWLEDGMSGFERFSDTLGVPNYSQSIAEDLGPGMMFYKQLMNAASYSCEQMIINDLEVDIEGRKLLNNISEESSDPAEVQSTIATALVRFHGEEENLPLDGALISKWYALWSKVHEAQPEVSEETEANIIAWQLVCEAMILSPNFYTY